MFREYFIQKPHVVTIVKKSISFKHQVVCNHFNTQLLDATLLGRVDGRELNFRFIK